MGHPILSFIKIKNNSFTFSNKLSLNDISYGEYNSPYPTLYS